MRHTIALQRRQYKVPYAKAFTKERRDKMRNGETPHCKHCETPYSWINQKQHNKNGFCSLTCQLKSEQYRKTKDNVHHINDTFTDHQKECIHKLITDYTKYDKLKVPIMTMLRSTPFTL